MSNNALAVLKGIEVAGATSDYRLFEAIEIGDFSLSAQASQFHYCTPRRTLPELTDYSEIEVAIFNSDEKGGGWVNPHTDARFANVTWADSFEEGECPVGSYVDRDTVVQIVKDLFEISGKPLALEE